MERDALSDVDMRTGLTFRGPILCLGPLERTRGLNRLGLLWGTLHVALSSSSCTALGSTWGTIHLRLTLATVMT